MIVATNKATETFPLADFAVFKQQVLTWASRHEVCCFLDHNAYQRQLFHEHEALVAVGVKSEMVQVNENGAFEQLKRFSEKTKDWLFGFLTYDLKNDVEQLHSENHDGVGFPAIHFFQPKVVFEISFSEVKIHCLEKQPFDIFQEVCQAPRESEKWEASAPPKLQSRFSKKEYLETVEMILRHIRQGDIYEMNFCQEFFAEGYSINPLETFRQLNSISKAPFSSFYRYHDRYLLCASPERFLKKEGHTLISQPIKGTIRRGRNKVEDEQLRAQLFHSPKDRSENVMIVDLVRNDLSRSCEAGSVKVDELYGTYPFEHVHQLISTVKGTLRENFHFVDAIREAFPMGSMTGAPKVRSMQLIEKYERSKRGLYSGAVGYIRPGGDFDFNVVIRSLFFNAADQYLSFQVGGAIVDASDPLCEYEECLLKAKGMFSVLGVK